MKPISDIRLFRSIVDNTDGNSFPAGFCSKHLNVMIHRIVMKLREYNFSLGEFDYLYINFTTCLQPGIIRPANRSIDPHHKWYRYYDVGVSLETYNQLESEDANDFIIHKLQEILTTFFEFEGKYSIEECFAEAMEKGEQMMMLYKTKQTNRLTAKIYLQYLDSGKYLPHLFVNDSNQKELLHQQLEEILDLSIIGEIQLNSKKVTIKPRKNSFTQNIKSLVVDI